MFLIKVVQKKHKTNNKTKAEKLRKEKNKAKGEQSKKSIKEIWQSNSEKKRYMQPFKPRKGKLK